MKRTPFLLTPRRQRNIPAAAQAVSSETGTSFGPADPGSNSLAQTLPNQNSSNPNVSNQTNGSNPNIPNQSNGGNSSIPNQTNSGNPNIPNQTNGSNPNIPNQGNGGNSSIPNQTNGGNPNIPNQNNGNPNAPGPDNIIPEETMTGPYTGSLRFSVIGAAGNRPLENVMIEISYTGEPQTILQTLTTDSTGLTPVIELPAPPLAFSLEPFSQQPYSEYTFRISKEGYEPVVISGAEILPTVTALQNVVLDPLPSAGQGTAEAFVIGPHTLYGEYPPKIIEPEIQPVAETGEIVLSRVVIPEYVVVHDGPPTDSSAPNYYVPYRDYIKNVASSEIYATWPSAAIYANILAIQSFTLNRVYTEFYRNKGYDFTITSSTAFDHKWINERNIYDTISQAVDDIFNNYLSRPGIRQPILTQYCDGKRVTCPNLMSQWGSKSLADSGYTAIQILRYFYGDSIYINTTDVISGIPSSYPGEPLTVGSTGSKVRQMQEQLDAIANVYYPIPNIAADGIFGQRTREAVLAFQKQFDLPQTGVVDFRTWYKISQIYVAISRIAEYS